MEDIYDVTKYEFISGVVLSTILHNSKKYYKEINLNKFNYIDNNLQIKEIKKYLMKKY